MSLRPPPTAGAAPSLQVAPVITGARSRLPWVAVGAAVAWNLFSLRAETLSVAYLDDSSVHEQMVRFATRQLRAGHLPLESWFPFLGQGSPQFLHYQSLPAMLTGALGLAIGPDVAFRWTLYLLLSLWPVSVYLAARLFGYSRVAAASCAVISPFLVSATGIGYEQGAYVWSGYGVWTQLWASLTLPLAWGFSWRAVSEGRSYRAAVAFTALTVALHFETGYLALLAIVLWPAVAGGPLRAVAVRAVRVLAGSLLACAWVIVPLIDQRPWAAINESLQRTALVNGYGAGRVLGWLVTGQLLDHGRVPVLTVFAGIGLVVACARWGWSPAGRALVVVLVASLCLSFGRTTFGSLVTLIPGGSDVFFRRFAMGAQLAAVLLAGGGAAWLGGVLSDLLRRRSVRFSRPGPVLGFAALVLALAPAWLGLASYDRANARAISAQRRADVTAGVDVDRLVAAVRAGGGGRVYAGMASNWGVDFTVGAVPVFKYLEDRDVDVVGYTLRTASLMSGPETHFDEVDPSDYVLFAIRYLILPSGWSPPVHARLMIRSGPYSLWRTEVGGYVQVGRQVGEVTADRSDLGARTAPVLRSSLAQNGDYLRVAYGGRATTAAPAAPTSHATGSVIAESDALDQGFVSAVVRLAQPGLVVLSASFDPGWTVSVDGRGQRTEMVAPAIVGTTVAAGTHRVEFRYRGYTGYPMLLTLAALTLGGLLAAQLAGRSRRAAEPRLTSIS